MSRQKLNMSFVKKRSADKKCNLPPLPPYPAAANPPVVILK